MTTSESIAPRSRDICPSTGDGVPAVLTHTMPPVIAPWFLKWPRFSLMAAYRSTPSQASVSVAPEATVTYGVHMDRAAETSPLTARPLTACIMEMSTRPPLMTRFTEYSSTMASPPMWNKLPT